VGALVELSRYSVATGERIVRGQRIVGVVRRTDAPADGQGRTYVVERGLTSHDELLGLVTHYVEQRRRGLRHRARRPGSGPAAAPERKG
jgi:hypothetical protein